MVTDIEQARLRLQAGLERLSEVTDGLHRWAAEYRQRAREEQEEQDRDGHRLPAELRGLQEQIDRGELTWRSALSGEADDVIDPRVRELLAARLAELAALGDTLRPGGGAR